MIFVLYKNSSRSSGRALRDQLTKLTKTPVAGGFPSRTGMLSKEQSPLLVNLGVAEDLSLPGRILNSREMVRAASNKREARRLFHEARVPSPPLFLNYRDIREQDLPVVGRTSHHAKGQGFWLCTKLSQVAKAAAGGATHFLAFIPETREYRVHTFAKSKVFSAGTEKRSPENYVSVKVSEKVWVGKGRPDPNEPQKNHDFGWSFLGPQNRREEELDVVRQAAKEAIAALGMDFGAVDVMYQISSKLPFVLEVNSAPSLSDETADTCERYARRILSLAGVKETA